MLNRLLVTGGCGFIGSNFVRYQLENHPERIIINLDKLTYAGNPENLSSIQSRSDWNSRYHFVHGDIVDREFVEQTFKAHQPINAVIHFAAESHVDRSLLDSRPFVTTNVIGTQVLLDVSRSRNIQRFLQVSTDEVYGSLGKTGAFTEESPLAPNSPYAASKAAADLLVRSYVKSFAFPAITTRCSNNYGPFQFPEKLIPLFLMNAMQNESLPVYGTGENVRDWIHVLDHCRGIEAALEKGRTGEVYHLGGNSELSNLTLTKLLLKALGKPDSLIKFVEDRAGHDYRYAIDFQKSTRELDWSPEISFEEGLATTIQWYQENHQWLSNVKSGAYRNYYQQQYGQRLSQSDMPPQLDD